ncbi:DUF4149 domain-containing protein [Ferrimonas pelagia]|uniref:TMEM205-like domain-containing protein n=1 Tax=Ferrimonas pelagia TaxID=1177826 RepID=A0ABP9F2U8_9GAMM
MSLLQTLYALLLATLFGGMLAYMMLFLPVLFSARETGLARRFQHAFFPWLYVYCAALCAVALLLRWLVGAAWEVSILTVSLMGFLLCALWLMPAAERAQSRRRQGFVWWHRIMVAVNSMQLLALALLSRGFVMG